MINDFSTIYLQGSKRDTSGFTRRDRDTELKVPFDQQEEEEKGEQNRWLMSISDALFLPSPFEGVYVAREELYAMRGQDIKERPKIARKMARKYQDPYEHINMKKESTRVRLSCFRVHG